MKKSFMPLLILFFATMVVCAREKRVMFGSLDGVVIDERSKLPIKGVIVECIQGGIYDTTDESGYFGFPKLESNFYDFEFKADGYRTFYMPSVIVKMGPNKSMSVTLSKEDTKQLHKMVVTSAKSSYKAPEQTTSVIKLSRAEIENSPGALQDVNEALKILPSAIGNGDDFNNSLYVRGGSADENVYLIDGMEVSNISHWGHANTAGGAMTSLHPGFIDHLDFYAGGFPSDAPARLSAATVITLREGSKSDHSYQVDMNLMGLGLFCDGYIIKDKFTYMINGRVSFLNLIQGLINTSGLPLYQNGQLKLVYDINKDHKVFFNMLGMHDEISGTDHGEGHSDEENNDEKTSFKEDNQRLVSGLGWTYKSAKWGNNFLVSGIYSKGEFWEGYNDTRIEPRDYLDRRIKLQFKNNSSIFFRDKDILSFGADVERQDYLEQFSNGEAFYYTDRDGNLKINRFHPEIADVFGQDSGYVEKVEAYLEDTNYVGYRVGGHASYALNIGRAKVIAGLRNDYFTIVDEHGLSPRLSTSFDLGNAGTVSASSGLFYQYPTYANALMMKDHMDNVKLQRNWQVSLGYEKQLNKAVVIGAEVYNKYYDREPLYEIVDQRREIDTTFGEFGKKRAYGLELFAQKKKKDKFYYNIAYTLFNSQDQYKDKKWYSSDFNIRNNATVVLGSQLNRNHGICLRFDLSEGYPYTAIDLDASDFHEKYDVANGWNSKRRDFRTKIGLRYDLTYYGKRSNITAYVEVKNILNQSDIIHETYNPLNGGSVKQVKGIGILPIAGLTIDF